MVKRWRNGEAVFLGLGFVLGSVTGHYGHAPSPKPRPDPKILAPRGYSISSNALVLEKEGSGSGIIVGPLFLGEAT